MAQGDGLSAGLPEGTHINDKGQVVTEEGEVLGDAEDFGLSPKRLQLRWWRGGGIYRHPDRWLDNRRGSTSGPSPAAGGTAPAGEMGPGITADTIKIGVSYADDAEEANAAIGGTGATQINQKQA